jgi:head-tail adaptor
MMPGAGDYPTRFTWKRRQQGAPDTFGEKPDEYPVLGTLWGAVENLGAARVTEKASERQETTATIRLRNYPAVKPLDVLRDMGTGDEWEVETAVAGDNEIVCEVKQ